MMLRHLILFARAPLIGQAKRRLAADIGAAQAIMFYHHLVGRMIRRLACEGRWQTRLAVGPDRFAGEARRVWPELPAGVPVMAQGPGDIGIRMDRALRAPPAGPAVLVGTDIPGLRPRHIDRAFALLGDADVVLGPASDGGFWLVGLRRRPRTPFVFGNVRWSGPRAFEDTRRNVAEAGLRLALAETLSDVDDGAAHRAAVNRLW